MYDSIDTVVLNAIELVQVRLVDLTAVSYARRVCTRSHGRVATVYLNLYNYYYREHL